MSANQANGVWKGAALSALAVLQGLCFWTLSEIKTDIRSIQSDQKDMQEAVVAAKAQLAFIAARHAIEDTKPKTP